ncbi:MAG: helix-turn-helix transcriptional regulator [Candidatus Cloacimonetes bacterium]|nr:helix-turn-helix transcriptional regulator [Candidatus Cloacimonadota bacterium]
MHRRTELDKAIRFIENGLKTKLILEDIAEQANMSAWHFHRVFLASTGITVGEYIRKRRMSEAAKELVFTQKPIKQLAGEYQYESQAAFTRSFTNVYGVTPGKIRRQIGPLQFFHAFIPNAQGEKNAITYDQTQRCLSRGGNLMSEHHEAKMTFRLCGTGSTPRSAEKFPGRKT